MKGISPLIASVLLIGITMTIAGVMATWATSFPSSKLGSTKCVFALGIADLSFSEGNVTVRIENTNNNFNLSTLKASIIYDDPKKNVENILLKNYGAKDPLGPVESTTAIISLNETTKPKKVEVVAANCPEYKISKEF
ncbi:MAG: hypothetical protein V1900_04005 [Candidatus Aenigmatarchaeota archaeon]